MQVEEWAPAGAIELEPNALRAIQEVRSHVVINAGPGAGKTETLAQRADFLLRTNSSPYPRRILAISFKVDAARNIHDRVTKRSGTNLARRLDSMTFHGFAKRLIDRFRLVLTGPHRLDADYSVGSTFIPGRQLSYDMMVPLAIEILESSLAARWALRQAYSHVFLDEFQDCTTKQYQLIRQAFLGSDAVITAVGDTKQRIMGWAGAMDGIFLTMASDFTCDSLYLYTNFRSKDRLRRVQNAMVLVMDPDAAIDPATIGAPEGEVQAWAFEDSPGEAAWVAATIDKLAQSGLPLAEIGILFSKQIPLYAADLLVELDRRGIPYRDENELQDLSSDPVGRLIFDFLRVSLLEQQSESYQRLLNAASIGMNNEEAENRHRSKISRFLTASRLLMSGPDFDSSSSTSFERAAKDFLNLLGKPALRTLSPDYQQGARLEGIVAQALGVFFKHLDSTGNAAAALNHLSDENSVRILTIHKCKGLEFEHVFIMACENETFWGQIEEERAAFFVAISRAKSSLYVTCAGARPHPDGAGRGWSVARTPQREFVGYLTTP